jgi:hypothetical protein
VDHVGSLQVELHTAPEREDELAGAELPVLRVLEAPRELLGEDVHVQGIGASLAVAGEDDRAHDRDRRH